MLGADSFSCRQNNESAHRMFKSAIRNPQSAIRNSIIAEYAMTLARITLDPVVCHGQACIRGTRIPVHIILGLLGAGETIEQILEAYPHITREDIQACLTYAAALSRDETVEIPAVSA